MSDELPDIEMPRYKSHKTVWALEIAWVSHTPEKIPGEKVKLDFRDPGYASIEVDEEMFSRYKPVPGDFYVQYQDGYKSFSPRKAFLEGYSRENG